MRRDLSLPELTWLDVVPFAVPGLGASWAVDEVRDSGARHRLLQAHTESGLEAVWEWDSFSDTRAIECFGRVRNASSVPVGRCTAGTTLDWSLELPDDWGQSWVRTINGVRFIPHYFPPYDFASVDRQLVDTPQVFIPLTLRGGQDGRSSHEHLPCLLLCNEQRTRGLAVFLEWPGLWEITIAQSPRRSSQRDARRLHLRAGLQGLALDLGPGQGLPLPRVLVLAFEGDLEAGANALRRHLRRHVMPSLNGQEVLPPLAFNHWFAFENDFTAEVLKPAVQAAAGAGLEYFCVDAAWFAGNFRAGIGNWDRPDPARFPDGIAPFAEFVQSQGLKYGTWFEPEFAHQDSDLYREHPEWFLPTPPESALACNPPGLDPATHLMDFGLPEVQQWWVEKIVRVYREWHVRWIRWDFNGPPRPNWEGSETAGNRGRHQIGHIQGLFAVLDQIMEACPDLFIEQCASGGHRIDLGTIRRGHSFWMNDHTTQSDIVRALQHGLNQVLPGNYANTNLCQFRHDYSAYDYLSHCGGGFGYSGRLWEAPHKDFLRYAAAVADYKRYRHLLLGDYFRPTGIPQRADEPVRVRWQDRSGAVEMVFNLPEPGEASLILPGS